LAESDWETPHKYGEVGIVDALLGDRLAAEMSTFSQQAADLT